jgi:cytochrome c oxidase assembly protein subunit 11
MKIEIQKQLSLLCLAVLGMFGFCFALVPLYDVFCQATGINGKPQLTPAALELPSVAQERQITVEFVTHVDKAMPWFFKPEVKRIQVHPGELKRVIFEAENLDSRILIGQAIPSISPGQAALYFHKTECFCFNQQQLAPKARVDMPLIFYIDTNIPDNIKTLTLSYTLYNMSDKLSNQG